jgi:antitoxin MazE
MKSKVQKWGNSLALRIPRSFAAETGLRKESGIEISLDDGRIIITPERKSPTLRQLLAGVNKNNLHGETDTGAARGNEIW